MKTGIDVGGTKIAGATIKKGKIVDEVQVPTDAKKGRKHVLNQIRHVIKKLRATRVGIGVPGLFNGSKLIKLPNVPVLDGVDLRKALGVPITIENDANCFALAEQRYGSAKGTSHMIGIIMGTGVGAGIILSGKIYVGAHGHAGEVGHMIADIKTGECWEDRLSGPNIFKKYRKLGGNQPLPSSIWSSNEKAAKSVRKETSRILAMFVSSLVVTFDPEVIVLGGGVSNPVLVKDTNKILPKYGCRPILKLHKLKKPGIIGASLL